MSSTNLKGLLSLLVCIFFWASAFVFIRHFMLAGFNAGGFSFARYFVASIVMLFIFIPLKNKVKPSLKDFVYFAILGFLGFFVYNVFLNLGEQSVSAGVANFIIFQVPILEIIIAIFFFGERLNKFGVIGLVVCMLGVYLIALSSKSDMHYYGIVFVYIAAFAGALYTGFQKKMMQKFHPIEAVSYFIWFGTLFLVIFLPQAIYDFSYSNAYDVLLLIYMGVFPGALSYLLWGYAFKNIKISIASSSLYTMPIFTLFLGWLFLGEIPASLAIIGGIVAVIGAIIITRMGVKK